MGQLEAAFNRLRAERRRALMPFIIGGHPARGMTGSLLLTLEDAGADVLEVGIPFSDPLADGPTIQGASARALAQGATPRTVLDEVAAVRRRLRAPVVALTYWNPVLQFQANGSTGPRAFARAAQEAGLAGVIVPDLPVEEGGPLRASCRPAGLATVFLAAPTSPPDRLRLIARASQGFIYYVSVTGTTGARSRLPPALGQGLRQLRLITTKPVCVGFGISTPAQAAAVARLADGVIVGSALIHAIEQGRTRAGAIRDAGRLIRRLRRAVR